MIDILLSTYNGEMFIREQLDSIIAQTYKDWRLLIRDDGSRDNTVSIIESYAKNYNNIELLPSNGNIGVVKSFETLLKESNAEYFMFCDQDDVWLPNKIEDTFNKMAEQESLLGKSTPILIHTDVTVVDSELNIIAPSFFAYRNLQPDLIHSNLNYTLLYACTTGCTMLCNMAAGRVSLPFPDNVVMHDNHIDRAVAMNAGKCVALHKSTMLYRQHRDNVCGANKPMSLKERIRKQKSDYESYKQYVKRFSFTKYLFWKTLFYVKSRWHK
ncbi:MAG: glycosyltransferase family 2 protein [Paludibacteraceae bacterium]|nr:glycosyltransferase family 2 protein [Paludibacteraceae bacterium]